MTLLSVSSAPIVIGLIVLFAVLAVGYLAHIRLLRAQVDRALDERSSRLALSRPPSDAEARPSAAPARALGLGFGLPRAPRLRPATARSQRQFTTADDRELRTVVAGSR